MARHIRFFARTVMVLDGDVEAANKALFKILTNEGIIEEVKRRRYYEKPVKERKRKSYEGCKRIYNGEMSRKLTFISRTMRADPWVGH